ncbi:hypothetical protein GCM10009639_09520 [Kitasatospora putterlickiae]|uniref:Uncharacterized protein n=1 Tax=Kitasatospora putterlickiae TaxID=221725 RepID=A0ABN1XPD6_9ACTN
MISLLAQFSRYLSRSFSAGARSRGAMDLGLVDVEWGDGEGGGGLRKPVLEAVFRVQVESA